MTKIDTIETLTDFFDKLDLFEKYTVKELLEHFVCIDGEIYTSARAAMLTPQSRSIWVDSTIARSANMKMLCNILELAWLIAGLSVCLMFIL